MKKGSDALQALVDCGRQFYEREWMCGSSGNLSVRLGNDPLTIAITPKGLNKGYLSTEDLLTIKEGAGLPKHPRGHVPSSETIVHQAIYHAVPGAGAVFHVHPIYSTLISSFYGHPREPRMMTVESLVMMKGIGAGESEKAEVAIIPNWEDVSLIARDITSYVKTSAKALPVVLVYNHGLTGWGTTPDLARNHLEIMEYVCQYLYLKRLATR